MRYKPGHREEAHTRMVVAAGRGFRRKGFGGIGVDGLANEAEVTSGAFYGHFESKEAAFLEAVVAGIDEVHATLQRLRDEFPDGWLEAFIDTYLGARRLCDLSESCAIQSLSAEVSRAGPEVRRAYEAEMRKVVDVIAAGLVGGDLAKRQARAWALLSLLAGCVTFCRAVEHGRLASTVADAARSAALQIVRTD